jgi:hypothetical protein
MRERNKIYQRGYGLRVKFNPARVLIWILVLVVKQLFIAAAGTIADSETFYNRKPKFLRID